MVAAICGQATRFIGVVTGTALSWFWQSASVKPPFVGVATGTPKLSGRRHMLVKPPFDGVVTGTGA